jgi:hypothetical protein
VKRGRLRADPVKTAAFHQRGRSKGLDRGKGGAGREKGLERAALGRGVPRERATTPPEVWAAVLRRDGGLCVWSRHLGRRRRAAHPHHLLPKQTWPEFVGTRANIVGLTADLHMTHEHSPGDRLPWDALPEECRAFLRKVARADARAARLVETKYPAAGARADHPIRR